MFCQHLCVHLLTRCRIRLKSHSLHYVKDPGRKFQSCNCQMRLISTEFSAPISVGSLCICWWWWAPKWISKAILCVSYVEELCRSSKDLYRRKTINGWSKVCTFIWAFQISYLTFQISRSHTYNIQAYFLLPIISRVSLNSYNSQNLADDEKASFLKVVFRTCVALYYSA